MHDTISQTKIVGDPMITQRLPSGITCYIIPKRGYQETMMGVGVAFGSQDTHLMQGSAAVDLPPGTAHFLEHRLFAKKWGDAFSAFSDLGADVNAFTDFQKTAVTVRCQSHISENLSLLLSLVKEPHFTEKGMQQEKPIIQSEIRMMEDDPQWSVFRSLIDALYHQHPIKHPIAGHVEDLEKIDAALLTQCFQSFYVPERLFFVCVGDVDAKQVLDQVEKAFPQNRPNRITSMHVPEPSTIAKQVVQETKGLSEPIFQIGFKLSPTPYHAMDQWAIRLAMDALAGESSAFYQKAYEAKLLDTPLGLAHFSGDAYSFVLFSGSGQHFTKVKALLIEELSRMQQQGLADAHFDRLQKKHLGHFLSGFNSIEALCQSQLALARAGASLADTFLAAKAIQKNEVNTVLRNLFLPERSALSVVL